MGLVADTVRTSQFALGIRPFRDVFGPTMLTAKDQPHLAPEFVPMVDKAAAITAASREKARAEWASGFAARTQSGMPAWAGPPGPQETRTPSPPERPEGGVVETVI